MNSSGFVCVWKMATDVKPFMVKFAQRHTSSKFAPPALHTAMLGQDLEAVCSLAKHGSGAQPGVTGQWFLAKQCSL